MASVQIRGLQTCSGAWATRRNDSEPDSLGVRASRFSSAGEMQRELIPAIHGYRLLSSQQWSNSEADTLLC